MKKILTIIAILFAVNCSAQDTSYFHKNNEVFMTTTTSVTTKVTDTTFTNQYLAEKKKRKRKDKIMTITAWAVFIGVNAIFFLKN